jgi:ribosome-associated protein
MLCVTDHIRVPLREFRFTFSRSKGPGGQNVNKLNTKATLRWNVVASSSLPERVRSRFLHKYQARIGRRGELIIISQRFRDQGRNVADCLSKLRKMILAVVPEPKPRRATRPTQASRVRRLKDKEARSRRKQLRRQPPLDE